MYNNGYVGTGEDVARIRRMEKQREDQRKKFEALQKTTKDSADGAGLRQFGTSTEEVGHQHPKRGRQEGGGRGER